MHLCCRNICRYGDVTFGTRQNQIQCSGIITTVNSNPVGTQADNLFAAIQVASRLFQPDDSLMISQSGNRFRQQVTACAGRHIIKNLRDIDFIGNTQEVLVQPFLAGLL